MSIRLTGYLVAMAALAGWPCCAQSSSFNESGSTNCTMADFDFSLEFDSGDFFGVTVKQRNLSGHACAMDGSRYLIDFVPVNREIVSCYDCPSHSLQEAFSRNPSVTVEPGQSVRQTVRWKTSPQGDEDKCIQPDWMTGPVLLVAPSLVTKVCGEIQVSRMTLAPEPDNPPAHLLKLTSLKAVYVAGEAFAVQVSAAPGEPLPDDEACPTLYLRERSPDGTTRVDEVHPMAFQGCKWHTLGHKPGDWPSGFDVDAGATGRWAGVGEHVLEVFQVRHAHTDSGLRMVSSNVLHFQVIDPETMPRKWAGRADGIGVDLTLDKDTYPLGEDVPLHIAMENMDSAVPIYGSQPVWDPCEVVNIQILDSAGHRVTNERLFEQTSICAGHGFGPSLYKKGKVVPIERSLGREGLLPNALGDYIIVVTWAPWTSLEDPQVTPAAELKPVKPVRATATIHIVAAQQRSDKAPHYRIRHYLLGRDTQPRQAQRLRATDAGV